MSELSIIIGLSAGRDSRGALAALRDASPRLFTFVRSKDAKSSDSPDSRVASDLARICNLNLEIVRLPSPARLDETTTGFASAFRRNTGYVRGSNSGWIKHFADGPTNDLVFIRGYGGEIMRGFYREIQEISPKSLAHLYDVNAGSRLTRDRFKTFIDVAKWHENRLYDYGLADIFYWEHRMGVWGASALAESDMAFRSVACYNSRNLFMAFLGLPEEHRNTSALFEEATCRLAPEFADTPYES
ncbi:hypothetical protein LY625_09190 [Lysobacter sp. GX 14042]|uniref:hypothetical protein n=1 Tax=Lysobacter sp. GX 14042 TaxID=2907155 RepID=UPI001F431DCE|nr:hypothetical protein [Lysobacter sp. GX 14042]MCE7032782.1 hypothetical protein [Lysobacter sp. GX 14042]